MNIKLLLAESLELLRKTEIHEHQVDATQEAVVNSSRRHRELSKLKNEYSAVYDQYIHALEMINYVRRTSMGSNEDLVKFCAEKMSAYMNHCEKLRAKEQNILIPLDQVDEIVKEGFVVKSVLLSKNFELGKGRTVMEELTLTDGCYEFIIKNTDDYSIAAPIVEVALQVKSAAVPCQVTRKKIPSQCGWCRFIGAVQTTELKILIGGNALVRKSHVHIEVRQLVETNKGVGGAGGGEWLSQLPKIDCDDLSMLLTGKVPTGTPGAPPERHVDSFDDLANLRVPYTSHASPTLPPPLGHPFPFPQYAAPPPQMFQPQQAMQGPPPPPPTGLRMKRIRTKLDGWPAEGGDAVNSKQTAGHGDVAAVAVLAKIGALPDPTDICGDVDMECDFAIDADELCDEDA